MLLIVGIILFVALIIVHEFGHYYAAKKSGVVVEEFGIGFPPRLVGKRFKKDDTLYSINLLPLGGFVKLKGEHDADDEPGSYGAAPFSKKTVILLAGVGMNLLAAALLLTIVSWMGMPRVVDNQFAVNSDTHISRREVLVAGVIEDSPAAKAGLAVGDRVLSLNGEAVTSAQDLVDRTAELAGQEVFIAAERQNEQRQFQIELESEGGDDGYLGIEPSEIIIERSTWSAPLRGIGLTAQFSWLTLQGLGTTIGQLFSGNAAAASQNVAGPVGVVALLGDVSEVGLFFVLFFVALISIALAVMNALPIPALDGGRLFVSGLFKIFKKPLDAKLEERIHATGMTVLIALIVLITVVDIRRFF